MINVWVNGCFDILHPGHIELFKVAKSLGDILIVGVDVVPPAVMPAPLQL